MTRWRKIALVLYWLAAPLVVGAVAQIVSGLPFTLTNGTVADATQVMADFNQIVNNVNANAAKNGVNNDITALSALVTPVTPAQGGTPVFIASGAGGGSANAQTVAATLPSTFALTANYAVVFVPSNTNTGATTLTVNATAAKNVLKPSAGGLVTLAGGEIVSGQSTTVVYDGTQFVLTSMQTPQEPVNAQTGASYAIANSDNAKLITTSNAGAQAYTIAQAGTANAFPAGWYVDVYNKSTNQAGIVTLTPTTSTIDGAATLVLNPGGAARIVSDGTNYQVANRQGLLFVSTQFFTGNGTYNRRPGLVYAIAECLGGGGSGAGGTATAGTTNSGGGGGAGGYTRIVLSAATIGASQTVTVGAAGTAPAAGNTVGGNGGTSSLGTLCVAGPGIGGTAGSVVNQGIGGAGGVGTTGTILANGSRGYNGGASSIGTVAVNGGQGGSSPFGQGGSPGAIAAGGASTISGNAAAVYGSGGGGGAGTNTAATFAGGNGSAGFVMVTEFSTQ